MTQLPLPEPLFARVSDAGLEHLMGLTQLEELYLGETGVDDGGVERLRGLSSSKGWTSDGTKVSNAGLEHLTGLTQLRSLDLASTKISDAGLEQLKNDPTRMLSLTDTEGQRCRAGTGQGDYPTQIPRPWQHQGHRRGLEHLQGTNPTQTTGPGRHKRQRCRAGTPRGLGPASKIYALYGTKVTDAGLKHLKGLTQLADLNIRGTKASDAGVQDLRKALPKADIWWP